MIEAARLTRAPTPRALKRAQEETGDHARGEFERAAEQQRREFSVLRDIDRRVAVGEGRRCQQQRKGRKNTRGLLRTCEKTLCQPPQCVAKKMQDEPGGFAGWVQAYNNA